MINPFSMTTNHEQVEIPAWFRLAYQVATGIVPATRSAIGGFTDEMNIEQIFWPIKTPAAAVTLLIETARHMASRADSIGDAVGFDHALRRVGVQRPVDEAWYVFQSKRPEAEVRTTPRATLMHEKMRTAFGVLSQPNSRHVSFLRAGHDAKQNEIRWGFSFGGTVAAAIQACAQFEISVNTRGMPVSSQWAISRRAGFSVEAIWSRLRRHEDVGGQDPRKVLGEAHSLVGEQIARLERMLVDCEVKSTQTPSEEAATVILEAKLDGLGMEVTQ